MIDQKDEKHADAAKGVAPKKKQRMRLCHHANLRRCKDGYLGLKGWVFECKTCGLQVRIDDPKIQFYGVRRRDRKIYRDWIDEYNETDFGPVLLRNRQIRYRRPGQPTERQTWLQMEVEANAKERQRRDQDLEEKRAIERARANKWPA